MKAPRILLKILIIFSFSYSTALWAQNIGVVDIQKVFDGYHKVKEARERLNNSRKIAKEEIGIFREELSAIVKELKETEAKMAKSETAMMHEFEGVRTGKANPALVENLMVDAYGSSMRLRDPLQKS